MIPLPSLLTLLALPIATYAALRTGFTYSLRRCLPNPKGSSPVRFLVIHHGGMGEREMVARIEVAASELGWHCAQINNHTRSHIRWFVKDPIQVAVDAYRPDFILCVEKPVPYYPGCPNYKALTLGVDSFIKGSAEKAHFINEENYRFDAWLPTFRESALLERALRNQGKEFRGFCWYPTVHEIPYTPNKAERLFYCGANWDETRSSAKYTKFFQLLDERGYLDVYGPKHKWTHLSQSARGFIPFDGKSLVKAIKRSGIALLLHTDGHRASGAPTSRIFEAAAAAALIITDHHPFIEHHFGNNVLYVDTDNLSAEAIFEQIDTHCKWALSHLEEAQAMGKECHEIYRQGFTMEQQLRQLHQLHLEITELKRVPSEL